MTTKFEELTAGDVSDEEHDPKNAMSPEDTEKFGEECVKEINKYRQKHSADKYVLILYHVVQMIQYFVHIIRYIFSQVKLLYRGGME